VLLFYIYMKKFVLLSSLILIFAAYTAHYRTTANNIVIPIIRQNKSTTNTLTPATVASSISTQPNVPQPVPKSKNNPGITPPIDLSI